MDIDEQVDMISSFQTHFPLEIKPPIQTHFIPEEAYPCISWNESP